MSFKKTNYIKLLVLYLVFSIVVLFPGAGTTIAKYSTRNESSIEASKLAAFHISSDLADLPDGEGNPVSSVSWYSGIYENGIRIRLYNYEKDNVALISESDITYSVSVEAIDTESADTYTVTVQDGDGGTVAATDGKYVLPAIITDDVAERNYQDIIIVCNSGTSGIPTSDFNVTVSSSKPFEKTLSVMVKLVDNADQPDYTVTDHGWYDVVTIHTNGYAGDINITWDDTKIAPDNNDLLMESWVDVNTATLTVGAFETYELIFTEDVAGDYAVPDKTLFDPAVGINLNP